MTFGLDLALTLRLLGLGIDAEIFCSKLLARSRRVLGSDHSQTKTHSIVGIGSASGGRGNF